MEENKIMTPQDALNDIKKFTTVYGVPHENPQGVLIDDSYNPLQRQNVMFDNTLKVLDKVTQSELQSMSRVVVGAITKPWVNMMPQPATDEEVEKYLCLV